MSMKRFVPKKRSKKKAESNESPEDIQLKELAEVFNLGQPTDAEPLPETPVPVEAAEEPDLLGDLRQGVFVGREGAAPTPASGGLGLGERSVEEATQVSDIRARPMNLGPQAAPLYAVEEPALPEMQALDLGLPTEEVVEELALPEMQAIDLGLPTEEAMEELALPEMQVIDLGLPTEEAMEELALPEMQAIDLGLEGFPTVGEPAAAGPQAVSLGPEPVRLDIGVGPSAPPIEGRPMTLSPGEPVVGGASAPPVGIPGQRPGSGEVLDALPGNLKDIFRKKVTVNPQLKALLRRHGRVDVHELADELQEFARSVGATEEPE